MGILRGCAVSDCNIRPEYLFSNEVSINGGFSTLFRPLV